MVAQDGPAASYTTIPLPCTSGEAQQVVGSGACTLQDFVALAQPRAFSKVEDWCTACGNTQVAACRAELRVQAAAAGRSAAGWQVAVAAVVGAVGSLLLGAVGLVVLLAVRRNRQRQRYWHQSSGPRAKGSGVGAKPPPGSSDEVELERRQLDLGPTSATIA